jgi:ketosteroid isomerase-like protein
VPALPLLAAVLLASGPAPDLEAVDAAWDAAVAAKDQATFLSRVAPDAVFAGASLLVGRDAIREGWARFFAASGPTLRWRPTGSGLAASGDLGWTVGDAVFEWKEKGLAPTPGRYVTVWAKDGNGRWMAALDGSLEPAPGTPATRKAARTLTSRDGSVEASIGTWKRGKGPDRRTGIFLLVRERRDGAWRAVVETEVADPPTR